MDIINIILLALIMFIGLILILFSFNKISRNIYPLLIFTVAFSLLYQISLISNYITGWDVNLEYYYSNMVIINSFWNYKIRNEIQF